MIVVCPLNKLDAVIADHQPSHVMSLLGAQSDMPVLPEASNARHLKLSFNDISTPREDLVLPGSGHIEDLLGFITAWERERAMVIHCFAGISRSTAAAYIAQCALNADLDEMQLAHHLRAASPSATPNKRMVELADKALRRDGRMSAAIAAIGRGADAWEGNVFELTVSF